MVDPIHGRRMSPNGNTIRIKTILAYSLHLIATAGRHHSADCSAAVVLRLGDVMRFVWSWLSAAFACLIFSSGAQAVDQGFSGEVSYEHLNLPKTQFTFILDNTSAATVAAPNGVVSKDTNHDGDLDGARVDLSYGGRGTFEGVPIVAGITGYYARHDDNQSSSCQSTSNSHTCSRLRFSIPIPTRNRLSRTVWAAMSLSS